MKPNFERMLQLAGEVFDARHDPDQLQMTDGDREKLQRLHPSTMTEFADANGPVVWILLIPTTIAVMEDFLAGKISESDLLKKTKPGEKFESIYLCSAMVLEEYRKKGLAKKLCL